MANPSTNVTIAPVWKRPLREQILTTKSISETNMDSLEIYLETIRPITFLFGASADNQLTGVYPAFATWNGAQGGESNLAIMKATHDCTMIVEVIGYGGFAGAANTLLYRVSDEAGNDITTNASGGVLGCTIDNAAVGKWVSVCFAGRKHYNVGQTMGYSLAMSIQGGSNNYVRAEVRVDIIPRRRSAVSTNNYA